MIILESLNFTQQSNRTGMMHTIKLLLFFAIIFLLSSCETGMVQVIPDNDSYSTTGISKIKIENYVNRLYIDIIGREPTDIEQANEVDSLNENELSEEIRLKLIDKLMTDTTYSVNEGSYYEAYCNNLYLLAKIRCLEGISDVEINSDFLSNIKNSAYTDSLEMNWEGYYEKQNQIRRLELLLSSDEELVKGNISYHEVYSFMIDNSVFDELNMNAFNFIRASFDQLLFRIPTEEEYNEAFDMVEYGMTGQLLGELGNSKDDYVNIIIHSDAMKEGMIRWAFQVFLQRAGTPEEVATLLEEYIQHEDINQIIAKILVTDEYANFY